MTETSTGAVPDTDLRFTDYAPNGTRPEEIRVRFGARPTQVVPLGWAETMLTELKRINPGLFGKLLVTASEGGR